MALGIPQCWKVSRPGRCYRADTLSCCPAAACCSCCSARAARGLEGQSEAVHRARRRGQDGGRQASRIGPQAHGYRHRITYLSEHPEPANQLLPRVHLVTSLLKRWLLGTHQGAVSPAHLAPTSTSSPAGSTAGAHGTAGCCSTAWPSRLGRSPLCRTRPWSKTPGEALGETTRCRGHLSQLDNQLGEHWKIGTIATALGVHQETVRRRAAARDGRPPPGREPPERP